MDGGVKRKWEERPMTYIGNRYQDKKIGLWNYDYSIKIHYLHDLAIGCMQYQNFQWFFDKPSVKFGEQIEWK